jgi:hypothetical protein
MCKATVAGGEAWLGGAFNYDYWPTRSTGVVIIAQCGSLYRPDEHRKTTHGVRVLIGVPGIVPRTGCAPECRTAAATHSRPGHG